MAEGVAAAGIAVIALDTGRVLLLQRALDPEDDAAGRWEFPGGRLEDGEDPRDAAVREWQEETGTELPEGDFVDEWVSENGVYAGFVYVVASETVCATNQDPDDRQVMNPDDPDGDMIEVCAWFDPAHLADMPALREECRTTPWEKLTGAAADAAPRPAVRMSGEGWAGGAHDPIEFCEPCSGQFQVAKVRRGIPIAEPDTDFRGAAAIDDIFTHCTHGDGIDGDCVWKAFLYRRPWSDPTSADSYQLQIGDVVAGKVTIIPEGIREAGRELAKGREALEDISTTEFDRLRTIVTRWHRRIARLYSIPDFVPPWAPVGEEPPDEGDRDDNRDRDEEMVTEALAALDAIPEPLVEDSMSMTSETFEIQAGDRVWWQGDDAETRIEGEVVEIISDEGGKRHAILAPDADPETQVTLPLDLLNPVDGEPAEGEGEDGALDEAERERRRKAGVRGGPDPKSVGMEVNAMELVTVKSKVRFTDEAGIEQIGEVIEVIVENGVPTQVLVQVEGAEEPVQVAIEDVSYVPDDEETVDEPAEPAAAMLSADVLDDVARLEELIASGATEAPWEGPLVVEGVPTGDRRLITPGALGHRDLPLPFMAMFRNPDGGEGHAGAVLVGRIDELAKDEGGKWWGKGIFDLTDPDGVKAARWNAKKMLRGVSVDLCDTEGDLTVDGRQILRKGTIMGATAAPFPALAECYIQFLALEHKLEHDPTIVCPCKLAKEQTVDEAFCEDCAGTCDSALVASGMPRPEVRVFTPWHEDRALVASGAPVKPPSAWFAPPSADVAVHPVRMGSDGRVSGYVAFWGDCHIGLGSRTCVSPPQAGPKGYHRFHTGQVMCADGQVVATGPVTMQTDHPDLGMPLAKAVDHYAHTGCAVADVHLYELPLGIYAVGAARPGVTEAQMREFNASDGVSPDWRPNRGKYELCALLVVNLSGYKVPADALVASGGTAARVSLATGEVTGAIIGNGLDRMAVLEARLATLAIQVAELTEERDARLAAQRAAQFNDTLAGLDFVYDVQAIELEHALATLPEDASAASV